MNENTPTEAGAKVSCQGSIREMSVLHQASRAARRALHAAARFTGITGATRRSAWRRSKLLVLCYHGVSLHDEHEWSDLYISQEHLERRLHLLRKLGATIVPLAEALQRMAANDLPECAVALTFDDGTYDFSARAQPVLAAANMHSTLYLTTWYCDKNVPVFDTMGSYLLWKARGRTIFIPGLEKTASIAYNRNDESFRTLQTQLQAFGKQAGLTEDDRQELLAQLARNVGVDFQQLLDRRLLQLMNPAEVRALDRQQIAIELHTHRHCTPRDHDLFMQEIRDNQEKISVYSGQPQPRRHFCYPSGDYVHEYRTWLRDAGVHSATTCDPGIATRFDDPYFVPRLVDTMGQTEEMFSAWVSGVASFTARRRTTNHSGAVFDWLNQQGQPGFT